MTDYQWNPLSRADLRAVIEPIGVRWWVAGGVGIDLFVGRETRTHGDIDVAMLRMEHAALAALFPSWDICIAASGELIPWDGRPVQAEHHQFWVRRRGDVAWAFEVLLEDSAENDWQYRHDPRVTMPIARFGRIAPDRTPYVAPEVALLYKSRGPAIDRNVQDFDVAAPLLDAAARAWLSDALEVVPTEHPWIARLRSGQK